MCKMQLAELNDSYLSTCHELHKSKEKNLAIAGKMTRSVMCKHWLHVLLIPFGVQLKCVTVAASRHCGNCELDRLRRALFDKNNEQMLCWDTSLLLCRLETIIYKHAESEAGTAEKLVQAKHSPARSGKK